jgi:Ca2+-binding EF-hand superfamily protein
MIIRHMHQRFTDIAIIFLPNSYTRTLQFSGNGTVEFGEFESFMLNSGVLAKIPDETDQNLRDAFNILDKNHDGYIDKDELIFYMTKFGKRSLHP